MPITLDILLGLLSIGQIVTGVISWYFGMQVRLLRLELVSRDSCDLKCATLGKHISKIYTRLERVETTLELQADHAEY